MGVDGGPCTPANRGCTTRYVSLFNFDAPPMQRHGAEEGSWRWMGCRWATY